MFKVLTNILRGKSPELHALQRRTAELERAMDAELSALEDTAERTVISVHSDRRDGANGYHGPERRHG